MSPICTYLLKCKARESQRTEQVSNYSRRRQNQLPLRGSNTDGRPAHSKTSIEQCHLDGGGQILLSRHQELLFVYTTETIRICSYASI
jgi:hypothetical protein